MSDRNIWELSPIVFIVVTTICFLVAFFLFERIPFTAAAQPDQNEESVRTLDGIRKAMTRVATGIDALASRPTPSNTPDTLDARVNTLENRVQALEKKSPRKSVKHP